MQHQYFLECADGRRVPISKEAENIAMLSGEFFRTISTGFMSVIRAKNVKPQPMPRYKYGGRNNPRSPVNYRGA